MQTSPNETRRHWAWLLLVVGVLLAVLMFAWRSSSRPSSSGSRGESSETEPPRRVRQGQSDTNETTSCGLDILASDMDGAPIDGVEHCAFELSTGARAACVSGGTTGRATLEWACTSPTQVVLYSASPGWVASRAKLLSPTPGRQLTVQVRLTRAGASLSGRIEDALGGVIEGAFVRARCRSGSRARELGGGLTLSGPAGAFELRVPVHCEVASLDVSAPGYAATIHHLEHAREQILVRLFPAGQLRGIVVHEGVPMPGARVTLRGAGSSDLLPADARTSTSGARGEFAFESVPPGLWVLSASVDQLFGSSAGPIHVAMGEVAAGVEVALRQGVQVRVQVEPGLAESCRGGLLTVAGAEAPFAKVATLLLDGPGEYRVDGAPAHPLSARLECDGFPGLLSPPLEEIEYRWKPSLPAGRTIEGQVIDAEGKGVDGAHVWLKGQAGRGPLARADERGDFRLRGVQDGPATVWASATKSSPRASEVVEIGGEDIEDLTIELPGGMELRGRLLCRGTQCGLGAYGVELQGASSSCSTATDASGSFACWLDVVTGDAVEVVVEDHQGRLVESLPGVVGEPLDIELASWELGGQVNSQADDGPYQISAETEIDGRRRLVPIGVLSDPDGQFTLRGLSPDVTYWLSARSITGNQASAGPYTEGDHAELTLEALAQLELSLPCANENVEVRVTKSAQSHFPSLIFSTAVPADGTLDPFDFPPGTWHVQLGGGGASEVVTLEAGALSSVQLASCGPNTVE